MDDYQAQDILDAALDHDGGLYKLSDYICWTPGDQTITLDGEFTTEQLEAMVVYIKYRRENPVT
jgi:hypothetical protein